MIKKGYQPERVPFAVFLVSPFAAFISAVRHYKAPNAKNIVWLFIIFYGYTFVVSNKQLDSNRYQQTLIHYARQNNLDLKAFIALIYSEETNFVDIAQPLLTFLISRFTDDTKILFAAFGLIFGYFYSRNLWHLLGFVEGKIKKEALVFIVLTSLIVAIWQINGFRFWTAAHVFLYGLLTLFRGNRLRGVLICAASLLVHFSFILPFLVLMIYLILGDRFAVCLAVYFSSFFITQMSPEALQINSGSIPSVFVERTNRYTSEAYIKTRSSARRGNWYAEYRVNILIYATNVLLVVLFFRHRRLLDFFPSPKRLLCYSLLIFAVSNFLLSVPSVGIRFQLVSLLVMFASFFLLAAQYNKQLFPRWLMLFFLPVALLFVIVEVRVGFDTIGVLTVIGNPMVVPFIENDVPLINLIK